jgi:hypothetical protein
MSELSEQLSSTVTRRETEHSISKISLSSSAPSPQTSPALSPAKRKRGPAADPARRPATAADRLAETHADPTPRAPRKRGGAGRGGRASL